MSELDNAMLEHMAYIVFSIHRPFCFRDFLRFEVNGVEYGMAHKTFRNKISRLRKQGIVELDFNSGIAFYTLEGQRFGKRRTPNHTGVGVSHNDSVFQMIKSLPMDKQSIHDIRLKFVTNGIYGIFDLNPAFTKDRVNMDIRLPYLKVNNAIIQIRIHRTDTVSVTISCSREPFLLDYNGIVSFFATLGMIQGLLVGIMMVICKKIPNSSETIPNYGKWLITMWHFGRDSLETYTGKKFEKTVEDTQRVLFRIYMKDFNNRSKIRFEVQEYPNKAVFGAIQEKLNTRTG